MTETSRECSGSLREREAELRTAYLSAVEAMFVRWQGKSIPLHRLHESLESPDRRTRERAWRLETGRWLADAPLFDGLWHSLTLLRIEMAASAGMEGYVALRRQELGYPPADPGTGRQAQLAVEEFVTSVLVRLHERRRRQLGLRTIRPWDLLATPPGFPADPLFATAADAWGAINTAVRQIDHERDVELAGPTIVSQPLTSDAEVEEVLARYSEALVPPAASSVARGREAWEDVAAAALPLLVFQGDVGAREAASRPTSLTRARIRHLERTLLRWAFGAMIDAFEEWAYAHPAQALGQGAAGSVWSSLWLRFLPAVDWAGLDDSLAAEWQRHADLFLRPGESMLRIASELELFRNWTQATHVDAWFQEVALDGQPAAGSREPAVEINELDLLDVARWMEDTIEELERADD